MFVTFLMIFFFFFSYWLQVASFFHGGDLQEWPLWVESSSCHRLDSAGCTMDPPEDTAQFVSQAADTFGQKYFRTKRYTDSEEWGKKWKAALRTPQVREYRGVGGVTSAASEIPLKPLEWPMPEQITTLQSTSLGTPHQSKWIFPEGVVICWEPTLQKILLVEK